MFVVEVVWAVEAGMAMCQMMLVLRLVLRLVTGCMLVQTVQLCSVTLELPLSHQLRLCAIRLLSSADASKRSDAQVRDATTQREMVGWPREVGVG